MGKIKRRKGLFLLILGLLPALFSNLFADDLHLWFKNISIKEGLSQNSGNCVIQDKYGFMWFGTEDGLNRYDGHEFVVYKNDPADPHSLADSYILSIFEDSQGILWVGTYNGGLNKYNREKNKFISYTHKNSDPSSISSNHVLCICEDSKGFLWIGTQEGLNRFDPKKEEFVHFTSDSDSPKSLSSPEVTAVLEDSQGVLWVGTENGLNRFNRKTKTFEKYFQKSFDDKSLSHNSITCLYEDQDGILWIGTEKGLNRFNPSSENFISYLHVTHDSHSLSNNRVRSICEDESGALWIGTYGGGLNRLDKKTKKFIHWKKSLVDEESLCNNFIQNLYKDRTGLLWVGTFGGGFDWFAPRGRKFIRYKIGDQKTDRVLANIVFSIYVDQDNILWIGTYGGGLYCLDRKSDVIKNYIHDPGNPFSLSNNNVRAIIEDEDENLWIGTYDGLNKFDRESEKFFRFVHEENNPNSLTSNYIREIYIDDTGILWIGTLGGGLNKLNPESNEFSHYVFEPDKHNTISGNRVVSILKDSENYFWIGTGSGLNRFDPKREVFTRYNHKKDDPNSLSNDRVLCVFEDRKGQIWAATYGGGINKMVRGSGKFIRYTEEDGLPNNVVYGILEGNSGFLWLSTNRGIARFDPEKEVFRNFDVNDGLQSNEFNSGAYYKSLTGELFFGGINGFNAFYPGNIKEDPYIPPVVFTDFQISYRSVSVGEEVNGKVFLTKSITETKNIKISYKEQIITFKFAALHFTSPKGNSYAYKMEGFDESWNYVGNKNWATYTNLPSDEYTFRVMASNQDGIWNERGASLNLTITPPFWETWWFRGAVALFLLGLVFIVFRVRTMDIRKRNKMLNEINTKLSEQIDERKKAERELKKNQEELERKVEERTRELRRANKELEKSLKEKVALLKEVHHRVKNNMQIVSSLLRLQSCKVKDEKALSVFKQSQSQIKSMALIHEKLYQSRNFAKIDFGSYIEKLVQHLAYSYEVDDKEICIDVNIDNIYLDINRAIPLGLVLNELVTNSLKYAFPYGEKGEIYIHMKKSPEGKHILIVGDTGKGIKAEKDVFESETLGIQLVQDLVRQLNGSIDIQRKKGIAFKIVF
ncbi:MAG: two-component regulator propeller domain-containing protein [Acidobacteriota bacterium]